MKLSFRIFLVLFIIISVSCVNRTTKNDFKNSIDESSILKEGYELFYLERASWISTDLMIEKYKDFTNIEGFSGYVTYQAGTRILSTYWKQTEGKSKIFSTFTFNDKTDARNVSSDFVIRDPNEIETILFSIQEQVWKLLPNDENLKIPKDCNFNFVYLRNSFEIRVFVIVGTKEKDVIPFGNDFEYTFDLSGKLMHGSLIHLAMVDDKGIVIHPSYDPAKLTKNEDGKNDYIHNHFASEPICITSTDICNMLLYGKAESYIVISKDYVSLFSPSESKKIIIFPQKFIENQRGR